MYVCVLFKQYRAVYWSSILDLFLVILICPGRLPHFLLQAFLLLYVFRDTSGVATVPGFLEGRPV